jgi:hypothetical protein
LDQVNIPPDVQQAWNIVAAYLNQQPEISFSINPWYRFGESDERNQYTIETNASRRVLITASEEWRWKSPARTK